MKDALESMAPEKIEMTYFFGIAAKLYADLGHWENAMYFLNWAKDQCHSSEERFFEAELYRLEADIGRRFGSTEQPAIVDLYQLAITTARLQQARSWELNAARSLAPLLTADEELQEWVAPVESWFSKQPVD